MVFYTEESLFFAIQATLWMYETSKVWEIRRKKEKHSAEKWQRSETAGNRVSTHESALPPPPYDRIHCCAQPNECKSKQTTTKQTNFCSLKRKTHNESRRRLDKNHETAIACVRRYIHNKTNKQTKLPIRNRSIFEINSTKLIKFFGIAGTASIITTLRRKLIMVYGHFRVSRPARLFGVKAGAFWQPWWGMIFRGIRLCLFWNESDSCDGFEI